MYATVHRVGICISREVTDRVLIPTGGPPWPGYIGARGH